MRSIPLALALVVLSACAAPRAVPPDPDLGPENAAHVMLYRPSSDWMGSAVEFSAYAGEEILGVLARGDAIGGFVKPGRTTIRVRTRFPGMSHWRSAEIDLDLRAGERYYLRFSQHMDTMAVLPGGSVLSIEPRLRKVTEATYEKRE